MKITCNTRILADAFSLAASVAPQRSPKEILRNVLLTADGNGVRLVATDTEIGISIDLQSGFEIESGGRILLPVQRVSTILKETTGEYLTIETDGNKTKIVAGRSRFSLLSEAPDEFPAFTATVGDRYHEADAAALATMIRRTMFATDETNSRYVLNGVSVETDGGSNPNDLSECNLIMVGTDGRRAAKATTTAICSGGADIVSGTTILPLPAAKLIERALSNRGVGKARLSVTSNGVAIQSGDCTITCRIIEGRYPNWRQVFPKQGRNIQGEVVNGDLLAAVRQASIATTEDSRGISMTLKSDTLTLSAETSDIGDSLIEISGRFTGDISTPFEIFLDYRFVRDFCGAVDQKAVVEIDADTPNTPVLMTTDDGYSYVIMPMAKER